MLKKHSWILLFLLAMACESGSEIAGNASVSENKVTLHHEQAAQKVEVYIDGRPFTEYHYAEKIKKPVLFPLRSANGAILTRGYPLAPRPGEQTDHLHHVGHWLNHGVVNQVDFWATTSETQTSDEKTYGVIRHRDLLQMIEGEQGEMTYLADWISDLGDTLLVETTRFVFDGDDQFRMVDRITTLEAQDDTVTFEDSKEGMMGIRVARFMEQPYDSPQELIGADGKPMKEKVIDNRNVNGLYQSSEGLAGDDIWGKRARWVTLVSGQDSVTYSVTIMDHPDNVNHPTHWMARGYGLFAANPLGSQVYSEGREQLNLQLQPGDSVIFKYRILLHNGEELTKEVLENRYDTFIRTY